MPSHVENTAKLINEWGLNTLDYSTRTPVTENTEVILAARALPEEAWFRFISPYKVDHSILVMCSPGMCGIPIIDVLVCKEGETPTTDLIEYLRHEFRTTYGIENMPEVSVHYLDQS